MKHRSAVVVLDDMRSTHNVGSAFRTCDAAGIARLFLCGTTPTPTDRFGRHRPDIAKVALGAEQTIPWTYVATTLEAMEKLKKEGYFVVAIEQAPDAMDYKKVVLPEGTAAKPALVAFIFGSEVNGIPKELLLRKDLIDVIAEIPMRGKKESLNISVSLGIALFRLLEV